MLNLKAPRPVIYGDTEWFIVEDGSQAFVNLYTTHHERYYQVNFATDMPVMNEPWAKLFMESFNFQP